MQWRSLLTIPIVFYIQTFDFSNPGVLWLFRGTFFLTQVALLLLWNKARTEFESRKETAAYQRRVWVRKAAGPNLSAMLGSLLGESAAENARPDDYEATTFAELEGKKVEQGAQAVLSGLGMNSLFSFALGIQVPLGLQIFNAPFALFENPTLRSLVLGSDDPRPYGELYEDPKVVPPIQQLRNAPSAASSDVTEVSGAAAAASDASVRYGPGYDADMEEAIFSTWERTDPSQVPMFEALKEAGKDINYQTDEDGWSALMVVAGSRQNDFRITRDLIHLGAKAHLVDRQGWTALHWAAFHNAAGGAQGLFEDVDDEETEKLLAARTQDGRTAVDLARAEKSRAVLKILEDRLASLPEESRRRLSERPASSTTKPKRGGAEAPVAEGRGAVASGAAAAGEETSARPTASEPEEEPAIGDVD